MKITSSKDHHSSAQAFASFMVVALSGGLFLLYLANKEYLEKTNMEGVFVLLSIIFIGFLFALVYLVNNSVVTGKKSVVRSSKKAKKSSRKSR